ncbi:MAG: hypothetical protein A6F72_03075 [Cycloclasticus sp. symbiont of Poecilosclerida sp. N]|nr:MAG: hypothetical protein A6F72_03075 [Cycloclasticus sp. symbiont of Poecilosclerida sp. N]
MKSTFKLIFIAIFATVSFGALAADWTVTQTATIETAAPDLKQGNATNVSNSEQAINGIALNTDEDSLASGSSQLATLTSITSLNLTQGPNVDGSSQAINYLEAQNVGTGSGGTTVTQTVTSESTATTLTQEVGSGGGVGNVQALNIGKASGTGTINNLNQVITESGTLSLIQNAVVSAENVQAVNYAFGQTIGVDDANKLEQATSVTGSTTFSQAATGGDNRQGGNVAVTSDSGTRVAAASQAFTASVEISLTQNMIVGSNDNVQALNQVDTTANAGTVGAVVQTFTNAAGSTTFTSDAGSTTNVQAANLVDTLGSITDLEQTFTATNSALVDFDMTGGGNTNIQAGNMARTDGQHQS